MIYSGSGLLGFPDGAIITKTFYYLNDERNPSTGRKLIETRLLIKKNGLWEMGNYLWNPAQDDAELSLSGPTILVDWIDQTGANRSINYQVPIMLNCIQCHDKNDVTIPIGPKARNLNFVRNGVNSLENFINMGLLEGAPSISEIESLPEWSDDTSFTTTERARAYMDVNCAHCHQPGGLHDANFGIRPDLRFETSFGNSNIETFKADIRNRVGTSPAFGTSMPLVGISILHDEGVQLIHDYIDSL
jgi:mono/diheme cytochrome c family protein